MIQGEAQMSDMLDDLEFREKIKGFSPEGQFLAQQIYKVQKNCPACTGEPPKFNKRSLIQLGSISSGVSVTLLIILLLILKAMGFSF